MPRELPVLKPVCTSMFRCIQPQQPLEACMCLTCIFLECRNNTMAKGPPEGLQRERFVTAAFPFATGEDVDTLLAF